ncbi:alpha-1,3-mannosyl-glycoprotein 4-beta-N-acetylglucosaminyltransferase C-like isoform X2 [Ambystoma mexicanum]|uniref:alpha-1,3-mannosyl-glycoprotein 4-beta-N-acetylglucosaminyltransferase C-like isoform X2 n=1 Tax=Ambystoma mexicanum TaxID=8296 RepID=UPI0037E87727
MGLIYRSNYELNASSRIPHDLRMEEEESRWAREVALQELRSERNVQSFQELWNVSAPLNISYHYLVGFPTLKKKYLTVGLCSVKRRKGTYLLETLKSIFKQSTNEELKDMVVVVHLADFDMLWNSQMAEEIGNKFTHHIMAGHLLVIHAPQEHYPPLEGLKRNYNDPEDRVKFRSKQNVDYAFLMHFCKNISTYYLMIEDDVQCSKSFFSAIKKVLTSRESSYWVTLEFSKLGYIGKLYQSSDLQRLAQFLLMFYQEMPCDWLLTYFRLLLTQKDVIRFKPSLFQHMGLYSSFQGTANRLKDDDFEEDAFDIPDNPPADIFTSIPTFENYLPSRAYSSVDEYFWGKSPSAGSYFTIVFRRPVLITRIQVQTGSAERLTDHLHQGALELGKGLEKSGKECARYSPIGTFEKGQFDKKGVELLADFSAECVRILVKETQNEWLIIRNINIWTKLNTS